MFLWRLTFLYRRKTTDWGVFLKGWIILTSNLKILGFWAKRRKILQLQGSKRVVLSLQLSIMLEEVMRWSLLKLINRFKRGILLNLIYLGLKRRDDNKAFKRLFHLCIPCDIYYTLLIAPLNCIPFSLKMHDKKCWYKSYFSLSFCTLTYFDPESFCIFSGYTWVTGGPDISRVESWSFGLIVNGYFSFLVLEIDLNNVFVDILPVQIGKILPKVQSNGAANHKAQYVSQNRWFRFSCKSVHLNGQCFISGNFYWLMIGCYRL